jgi:hypothetical protein
MIDFYYYFKLQPINLMSDVIHKCNFTDCTGSCSILCEGYTLHLGNVRLWRYSNESDVAVSVLLCLQNQSILFRFKHSS